MILKSEPGEEASHYCGRKLAYCETRYARATGWQSGKFSEELRLRENLRTEAKVLFKIRYEAKLRKVRASNHNNGCDEVSGAIKVGPKKNMARLRRKGRRTGMRALRMKAF